MNCILTHKHPKILWNQRYLSEFHKCHLQDAITYSFHGIWVDELWKKGLFTHPIYTLFDLSEYSSTSLLILSQAPSQRMNLNRGGGGGTLREETQINYNHRQNRSERYYFCIFKMYIFHIINWFYWEVPFCTAYIFSHMEERIYM